MSDKQRASAFRFGDWLVEPHLNRIRCGDDQLHLEPRSMDVLYSLLRHPGEILSVEDLLDTVWADRVVESNAVHRNINRIRRALRDDPHHPRYIETVPKRGYRTLAPVSAVRIDPSADAAQLPTPSALALVPKTAWRARVAFSVAFAVLAIPIAALFWRGYHLGDKDATGNIEIRSIAVLPFDDLSATPDLKQLAQAVTYQLVTRLDEVPPLQVASLSAVVPLVERGASLADIAQALDAPIVVSGHVQRDGGGVEIPVQVIRGADGRVLWSTVLRRDGAEHGTTARFVAGEISRFLGRISTISRPGPESVEAYRAWLNWHFHQANFRSFDEAKWIEQVTRLEPGYRWAHLDAAASYFRIAQDGQDPAWIERTRLALEAARRSGLAEETAYRAQLGRYLAYLAGDLDRGESLLRETGDGFYAVLLMDSGIPEPAVRYFELATAQLPANGEIWLALGFARGMAGDPNGALAAFEEGLRRSPDHPYLLLQQARALAFLGRFREAEDARARLRSLEPLPPGSHLSIRAGQIWLDAFQGRREAALAEAAALAEDGWHGIAGISFLELGDPRAAEQFERAADAPVAGRRMISSWLHPKPAWMEHPVVRRYLDRLGYTHEWRRELCHRALDFAASLGVTLACGEQDFESHRQWGVSS